MFVTVHNLFHNCRDCCRLSVAVGNNTDVILCRHCCQTGRSCAAECTFTGWKDTDRSVSPDSAVFPNRRNYQADQERHLRNIYPNHNKIALLHSVFVCKP